MALFEKRPIDPRVAATRSILKGSIVMFVICVPLVAILRSPILPFLVVGGSALAIAGVWFFGRSKIVASHAKEIDALERTVNELKERLDGVELRNRFEEVLAEKAISEGRAGWSGRKMNPEVE